MAELSEIDALISQDSLAATLSAFVGIASPTGEEAPLANFIAGELGAMGIEVELQPISGKAANAIGVRRGSGNGPRLLLYAPLDTVTSNDDHEDLPWAAVERRQDMRARAELGDGIVTGLGAHNPKGHAACIVEAARILRQLDPTLKGDVYFGFGAGGMPTHSRPGMPANTGHGVGCRQLLSRIPRPDAAIVVKPGPAVTWEEAGFVWIEVTVLGTHSYVGSIHLLPYRSAISNAAQLVQRLEAWFVERAEVLATDCVRPQAVISFIQAGWERMPAFTPACCRFVTDLRFGPNMTGDEAAAQFALKLREVTDELGIAAQARRTQTIEASRTPLNSPIVELAIAAWEEVEGRAHARFTLMSGATDANIVRHHGIPAARMGMPKVQRSDLDFQLGMNCASLAEMRKLTTKLVLSATRFCGADGRG